MVWNGVHSRMDCEKTGCAQDDSDWMAQLGKGCGHVARMATIWTWSFDNFGHSCKTEVIRVDTNPRPHLSQIVYH